MTSNGGGLSSVGRLYLVSSLHQQKSLTSVLTQMRAQVSESASLFMDTGGHGGSLHNGTLMDVTSAGLKQWDLSSLYVSCSPSARLGHSSKWMETTTLSSKVGEREKATTFKSTLSFVESTPSWKRPAAQSSHGMYLVHRIQQTVPLKGSSVHLNSFLSSTYCRRSAHFSSISSLASKPQSRTNSFHHWNEPLMPTSTISSLLMQLNLHAMNSSGGTKLTLCPACLARDCLCLWRPLYTQSTRTTNSPLTNADVHKVFTVLLYA